MRKIFAIALVLCATQSLADNRQKNTQKPSPRDVAVRQIDDWGKKQAMVDRDFAAKETRILPVLSYIAKTYPPDQWLERVQFLYVAISVDIANIQANDPESIIAKYYDDEKQIAGDRVLMHSSIKQGHVEIRFEELNTASNNGSASKTEVAARKYAVARLYYPQDKAFVSYRRDVLNHAIKLERGEMTEEVYKQTMDLRWQQFQDEKQGDQRQVAAPIPVPAQQDNALGNALKAGAIGMQRAAQAMQQSPRINSCTYSVSSGTVLQTCY